MAKEKKRSVLGFTVFLSVLALIASLFAISNETFRSNLSTEVTHAQSGLHANDWQNIERKATERFNRVANESGLMEWISKALLPEEGTDSNFINSMLPHEFNYRFVNNIQYTIYQASFRMQMLHFWLLTMIPMVLAFIITGYYLWKIKHFSMQSGNTIAIKLFFSGLITLVATLVAYILFPSLGLPGSFYLPAIVILAMGYLIGRAIASFHLDF